MSHEERRAAPAPPAVIAREFRYRERHRRGADLARELRPPDRTGWLASSSQARVVEYRNGQTNPATGDDARSSANAAVQDFPISRIREAGLYLQTGGPAVWSLIRRCAPHRSRRVDALYAADNPGTRPVGIEQTSLSPVRPRYRLRTADDVPAVPQGFAAVRGRQYRPDLPQFRYRAVPNPELRPEQRQRRAGLAALRRAGRRQHQPVHESSGGTHRVADQPRRRPGDRLYASVGTARAHITEVEAALQLISANGARHWPAGKPALPSPGRAVRTPAATGRSIPSIRHAACSACAMKRQRAISVREPT
jgi:hypothetical protein